MIAPSLILPADHPLRRALNDEVHARPPDSLEAPVRLSYLVLVGSGSRADDLAQLSQLIEGTGAPKPAADANHYSANLGSHRIKWERHTEFCRYTIYAQGLEKKPFSEPAISLVPQRWLQSLKGLTIAAIHANVVKGTRALDPVKTADTYFNGNTIIGSMISGGTGRAYTDFRIHADGFGRLLLCDHHMTPRQAGRLVQRLFEIDTYRMMALLALPVARSLTPQLGSAERELLEIMDAMQTAGDAEEPVLLDRLTKLEASVERQYTDNHYRFTAANAYYDLVQQRIDELREERIEGFQTFREFNDRRFLPAIATCRAVSARQSALSERIAHATVLLSTRVSVSREKQNQMILQSMDRRANLQLRLQQTVEGLSVAAITYYIVGLVYYAAKGLLPKGWNVTPEFIAAIAIPLALLAVGFGLRRFRNSLDDKS
jgi:uncharacterized membrane-anchored protein